MLRLTLSLKNKDKHDYLDFYEISKYFLKSFISFKKKTKIQKRKALTFMCAEEITELQAHGQCSSLFERERPYILLACDKRVSFEPGQMHPTGNSCPVSLLI